MCQIIDVALGEQENMQTNQPTIQPEVDLSPLWFFFIHNTMYVFYKEQLHQLAKYRFTPSTLKKEKIITLLQDICAEPVTNTTQDAEAAGFTCSMGGLLSWMLNALSIFHLKNMQNYIYYKCTTPQKSVH